MTDKDYMKTAVHLAKKGEGRVSPNPLVGAVIVKDGRIIGKGYHNHYGGPHAERNAIAACSEAVLGSTLYVTLEPCCHFGKQPPCTDAIINSGIRKVVIGSFDPNPKVSGKGIDTLIRHGIEVETGVLKERCDKLNEVFFYYISTGLPYVVMKYAMTFDGKTASAFGESKWITGDRARRHVHLQRNKYAAIMVGVGTVIADDPMLTCRIKNGIDPVRIVCDTNLRIPLASNIVKTAKSVRTVVATCSDDRDSADALERSGVELWKISKRNGHVDLSELMAKLGKNGIDSVMIEGGGTLNGAALECGIVNKVQAYIAPKLLGGKCSMSPIAGDGLDLMHAARLVNTRIARFGDDYLIEGDVEKCLRE